MSNKSGYEKQQNLSFAQFLAELPSFIAVLVSAILSRTLLVYVDLLDCSIYLVRVGLVIFLSKKLTKDLRFKYNYGVGKVEAISSLLCDGIAFFGLILTLGLSVYSIIFPEQPSDWVIAVVGLKVINVCFDTAFLIKQGKILKMHNSAISKANHAEALAALLFDAIGFDEPNPKTSNLDDFTPWPCRYDATDCARSRDRFKLYSALPVLSV